MATILVVDDRPSNRTFLTKLLGRGGHRLLEAGDGARALAQVRNERPDLVITDILMPTMDGYEFVQHVRSDPSISSTPIIFYTATYSAPQAKALADSCGVSSVLTKPCALQEILAAVNRELGTGESLVGIPAADTRHGQAAAGAIKDPSKALPGKPASTRRVASRLAELLEAGMKVMTERDPARLVELYFSAACDLVDSSYAAVGMLDQNEQAMRHVYAKGMDAAMFRGEAGRGGMLGSLLSGKRVLRTNDAGRPGDMDGLPNGHPPIANLLGIPVSSAERVYGWLYFADRRRENGFSEDDVFVANAVARQLALLYENATLYDVIQRHAGKLQMEAAERERAEHELQRFRMAMDASADSIYLTDPATMRFVDVNSEACRRLGYTREQLLGMGPQDVLGGEAAQIEREYDQVTAAGDRGMRTESPFVTSDGSRGWTELHRQAFRVEEGSIIVTVGRDITERKRADERIRRLNRVYAVLSGINGAIVRIRDREELFREACRIAVAEGEFVLARVIELDSIGRARIAATSESDSRLFQQIVDEYNGNSEHSQSFLALALRSEQPLISNDVANDPRIPNRAALTEEGNYAVALLPMIVEKRIVGTFLLRAKDAGSFDEEEMRLLLEMVSNMSFALDHISKERRLNYLAMYDPLTGLANRPLFLERLKQFIHAASPVGNKVALVLADIERLRTVNESLGRSAGDAVIKELAERLAGEAGKAEVARIGADHFAIVLQAIKGRSEVTRRIESLWQSCLAEPFRVLGAELRISAKAGVTLFPNDGAEAELLLRNAEAALVKAKELGERYVFYTSALTARTGEQLTLENRLRQALEKGEFVLHYQPKVELEARRIVGVEALIRWQSPELGLVPPMKFIPLMEETGLILDVGAWALDKAIEDHQRWMKLGLPALRVAVNVSAIQLRRRDFVATVQEALKRGATPPGVDLEITESLVMEDIESNVQKLQQVRGLGLSIAIDDFGTGYSSLGYLARLPVQALKIDRSFIITMLKDSDTMTLVRTIISLAHSLRLKVVAEGVDEEEQAKMLRLLRCDEMQGYLFSRPVPFDQLTALLTQGQKA
jgi:diguanylate cyclase (GGDEF)-like protein/PAS domain S-box-containing protein